MLERVQSILIGVGGADLRVATLAGVEIVVQTIETCRLERPRTRFVDQPGGDAYLDGNACLDGLDWIGP